MRTRAVVVAIAVAVAVVAAEEEEPRSSREDDDEEDVLFLRECWNELCRCRWPMVSRSRSGAVHDCFLWFAQSIHSRLLNSNECRVVVAVAYGTKVGVVGNTTRVESYIAITKDAKGTAGSAIYQYGSAMQNMPLIKAYLERA